MKTPKKVEFEFVEWLLAYETEPEDDEMKWKIITETHIYKLMTSKQAYKFWKKHIK